MKRSPLSRGEVPLRRVAPLSRGEAELVRRTPLKKRNDARRDRLFREQFGSEALVKWVRMQCCVVCGCWPSEAAHATSRGAGGKAKDILPLCPWHHTVQHKIGVRSFEERFGVSLKELAVDTERRWREYAGDSAA